MTLARAWSVSLVGVRGHLVEVETDISNGLPGFSITGLPDASIKESEDRVRAAIHNSGETYTGKRVTVGLSPASLPKVGSGFDIAIALTILAADGAIPIDAAAPLVAIGELGLDGRLKHVTGVLPAVAASVRAGRCHVVVAMEDAHEAILVPGAVVHAANDLRELVAWLRGDAGLPEFEAPSGVPPAGRPKDLADVIGHPAGRMAVEVAAAGGHHLLMVDPPGCGKTMLAERLPGILPALDRTQQLEVTSVHSVAGVLDASRGLVQVPPFRAPHHSSSMAALVGGGSGIAKPGAVSLAHHGVLFLDEAPEFRANVLDALRQPLESGVVEIARTRGTAIYPAQAMLVLAANPCRCASISGLAVDCECSAQTRARYLARLSGPFMDRIDIKVTLSAVSHLAIADGEPSAVVAERVLTARARQAERYSGTPWTTNAHVPGPELRKRWPVPTRVTEPIAEGLLKGTLSARGADRILRLAWTAADLEGAPVPTEAHVADACFLRTGT